MPFLIDRSLEKFRSPNSEAGITLSQLWKPVDKTGGTQERHGETEEKTQIPSLI